MSNGHKPPRQTLDFSDLITPGDTGRVAQEGIKRQNTLDFSDLITPSEQEQAIPDEIGARLRAAREDLYRQIGLRRGAWTGIIDMVTDAANDAAYLFSGAFGMHRGGALGAATDPRALQEARQFLPKVGGAVIKGFGNNVELAKTLYEAGPVEGTKELASGVVEGIVKPIFQYPILLLTGMEEDPNERYRMGRESFMNIAGIITGARAGMAVKTGLIGQEAILGRTALRGLDKAARSFTPRELQDIMDGALTPLQIRTLGKAAVRELPLENQVIDALAKTGKMPQWITASVAGAAEGIVGGFTTGYLEGSNLEDRLTAGTAYATLALPFGQALEFGFAGARALRGKPYAPRVIAEAAGEVARTRSINEIIDRTPAQVSLDWNNLIETNGNMAVALLRGYMSAHFIGVDRHGTPKIYGSGAAIFPTLKDPSDILSAVAQSRAITALPEGVEGPQLPDVKFTSVVHARPDGLFDVLVHPDRVPLGDKNTKFFEQTGFLPGQQIVYAGSDSYYIDAVTRKPNQRKDRVTLRHMVHDILLEDVPVRELSRPSSQMVGDLMMMQARLITKYDVWDPSMGLTPEPRNYISREGLGARSYDDMFYSAESTAQLYGKVRQFHRQGGKVHVILTDGTWQELAPGLNKFEKDIGNGLKKGSYVWIGGKEMEKIAPDGTKTKVIVGTPGEIVGYFAWDDILDADGKVRRGSQYMGVIQESIDPNSSMASAEMARERWLVDKVNVTHSNLSAGSAGLIAKGKNLYLPDKIFNRFGYVTAEVLAEAVYDGFMDFIGFVDGTIDLSDHITRIGASVRDTWGRTTVTGKVGQSLAGLVNQLDINKHRAVREGDYVRRFFTETGEELLEHEAVNRLREQNARGDIPRHRQPYNFTTGGVQVSWNDLVNSFVEAIGLSPRMAPQVGMWLESRLGQELLGIRQRKINPDRSSIPWLRERIVELRKEIDEALDEADTDESKLELYQRQWFQDTVNNTIVYERRLRALEYPDPPALTDVEKETFKLLLEQAKKARHEAANDLVSLASSYQFRVQRDPGGIIRFRDLESNQLLKERFTNEQDALLWMRETGNPRGLDVDGGGGNAIPPSAIIVDAMPPNAPGPEPWTVPHQFPPDSRVTKVMHWIDTSLPWLTVKSAFFTAIDSRFGTNLMSKMYVPLQTALMRTGAAQRPQFAKAKAVEDLLSGAKIPRDRWATISDYRQSMSPTDVVKQGGAYTYRAMTADEIAYAQELANANIDIDTVFEFAREWSRFQRDHRKTKQSWIDKGVQEGSPEMQELDAFHESHLEMMREAFGMDDAHMKAHEMFTKIRTMNVNRARLEGVTRLARSIMNNEPDRATFAANHKMTTVELQAAKMLDDAYDSIGTDLGVAKNIGGYMNHYRIAGDFDPHNKPIKLGGKVLDKDLATQGFVSDLMRTGEINVYERDPIKALVAYINAGYKARYFNNVWQDAWNAAEVEINKLPAGKAAPANVVKDYLDGMRGIPSTTDTWMQSALDTLLTSLGVKTQIDLRRDIVNTLVAAQSGAMLGFRLAQGIRDFAGFSRIYYSRFGAERYANALNLAFANGRAGIKKLAEDGKIPGLGIIEFLSEDEILQGLAGTAPAKIRDAVMKASKIGLDLSAQHNAYSLAHAMAYLDTMHHAAKQLKDLAENKITKRDAYTALKMNGYDLPIAQHFDSLVTEGKFEQAAEFLAQRTGAETAFIYGMQNHPYGWGNVIGRLGGQFGLHAMYARNYLSRLAGRGTLSERAGAMARFAAAETAVWLTGRTLGFNMRSWYLLPSTLFLGGPALQRMQQLQELAGNRGSMRQEVARREYESYNGKVPLLSELLPGAYAFSDYYQAVQLHGDHYSWIPVLGKGLGFTVDKTQRSFADELLGNYPRQSGRR